MTKTKKYTIQKLYQEVFSKFNVASDRISRAAVIRGADVKGPEVYEELVRAYGYDNHCIIAHKGRKVFLAQWVLGGTVVAFGPRC